VEAGEVPHAIPSIPIPIPVPVPDRLTVALNVNSLGEESDRIAKGGNRFTVSHGPTQILVASA
jgi:hypothetical protein